jgi:hypothetical protein
MPCMLVSGQSYLHSSTPGIQPLPDLKLTSNIRARFDFLLRLNKLEYHVQLAHEIGNNNSR